MSDFGLDTPPLAPDKEPGRVSLLKRWSNKLLLGTAALDVPHFVDQCLTSEINGEKVNAALLLGNVLSNTACWTFCILALSGGHFYLILLGSASIAFALGLADHAVFFRGKQFPSGLRGLQNGGLKFDVPSARAISSRLARVARVGLALVAGSVTALVVGITLESSAIDAQLQAQYLEDNRPIVQRAEADYAAVMSRAQSAYDAQRELVGRLAAAQKLDLRRAVRAARRSRRSASPFQRGDILNSQRRLAAETATLLKMGTELERRTGSHNDDIGAAIEADPTAIPRSTSLISRVEALSKVLMVAPWSTIPVMVATEIFWLGLDLLPLTVKTIYAPSTYNELLARHHLASMASNARAAAADITPPPDPRPGGGGAAPPRQPSGSGPAEPAASPRRRGRPRKAPPAEIGAPQN